MFIISQIQRLNDIVNGFDEIADSLSIEKIKTIGDAYFAVSGLHFNNNDHPQKMMIFAIRARNLLGKINKEFNPESLIIAAPENVKAIGGNSGTPPLSSANHSPDADEPIIHPEQKQKDTTNSQGLFFVFFFFIPKSKKFLYLLLCSN